MACLSVNRCRRCRLLLSSSYSQQGSTVKRCKEKVWLLIGAMIMGMGIWSMHFIGMMAFQMRVGITYDTSLLILSILASFIGSLIAFSICIQKQVSRRRLLISSITIGTAICSMHYLGMESMANVSISYDPVLFFFHFSSLPLPPTFH